MSKGLSVPWRWSAPTIRTVTFARLLGVGLYVILSKHYAPTDTNWAYGIVGTVFGFWLKGSDCPLSCAAFRECNALCLSDICVRAGRSIGATSDRLVPRVSFT